jgi:NodT family efflux transporter outer membrane factor (OMF) lipoprotein
MKKSAVLGLMASLSFACAYQERTPVMELETPPEWSSEIGSGRGGFSQWWMRFNDQRLNGIIEAALRRNYDLQAAASRVEAAAAVARIAGADLYPQFSGGLSGSRQKRNFVGFPFPGSESDVPSTTNNLFGVSLNVSWEADLWGRLRAGQAAAVGDWMAAEADLWAYRLSLIGQTAKAWFAAVEVEQQVRLSEATLTNYRATDRQVMRRYRLGLTPSLDVRLSSSNVLSQEAVLIQWRNQLQQIKRQLEALLGRFPEGAIRLSEGLPRITERVPAGLPADIIRRRPDLVAAERRLMAANARVAVSRKSLYPRISLTGSAGTSSDELNSILKGDYSVWNLVGNLLQPLFLGGRLRSGVDLAKARESEALAVYAGTVLEAFREVETALTAERLLSEREAALREGAAQAVAARELADDRYSRGLTDLIAVLEAQRRAFLSQSQLLGVQRLRLENRVDLYLSLGGGFRDAPEKTGSWAEENDQ